MANWDTVVGYMRANYKISEEIKDSSGNISGLKLLFDVGDLRSQLLFMWHEALKDGAEDWVRITSPFASVNTADLRGVLAAAGGMVCGGVASVGDVLVLSHTAPLENLDINELERPLMLVLHSADQLEQQFGAGDTF